jgi:hypothetical protein
MTELDKMFRDNKTQNIEFNSGSLTLNINKYDGRFAFILLNNIVPPKYNNEMFLFNIRTIYVTRVIKSSARGGRKELIDVIEKFKENPSKLFYDLMRHDIETNYYPGKPNKIGAYKQWYHKQIDYCNKKYSLGIPEHFKSKITKFRYTYCNSGEKLILLVNDDIYIKSLSYDYDETRKRSLKFSATEPYKVLETDFIEDLAGIWKDTITE